jgi:hypothetical protein
MIPPDLKQLVLLASGAGRFNQLLGRKTCQESFHLGVHLADGVLEDRFQLRDDVRLVALAVDQVPNGCCCALKDHRLACIEVEHGNSVCWAVADLGDVAGVAPDHGMVRVKGDVARYCVPETVIATVTV